MSPTLRKPTRNDGLYYVTLIDGTHIPHGNPASSLVDWTAGAKRKPALVTYHKNSNIPYNTFNSICPNAVHLRSDG